MEENLYHITLEFFVIVLSYDMRQNKAAAHVYSGQSLYLKNPSQY